MKWGDEGKTANNENLRLKNEKGDREKRAVHLWLFRERKNERLQRKVGERGMAKRARKGVASVDGQVAADGRERGVADGVEKVAAEIVM
ncbi:hypothetical protein AMTR_s00167p00031510 [Amborella trichopoda]|uniref:Uncharacterized protein n=1 Tax=Amborella trichopoda TaxID=13333 RepID=W1PSQ0_AMBTC|nr:hypothetical protein AMTR_s00167p00031510 [Amborella trichopoda]